MTDPINSKPFTNDQTKKTIGTLKPEQPTEPKKVDVIAPPKKPIEVSKPKPAKEVKPVAKDPRGMFDYSNCIQHKVVEGDTLLGLAQKYVVAFQQLRYFNHLSKAEPKIRVGQTIYIPNKPIQVPYGKQP